MYPEYARDGERLLQRAPAVIEALEILRDRWAFALMVETFYGVNRFDDYQHNLQISRNVLTKRLALLVNEGILRRHLYQSKPDRYEYRLTEKGRAMYPIFLAIQQWGEKYLGSEDDHDWKLVHADCGQVTHPHLNCDVCGREIVVSTMRLEPRDDQ